MPETIRTVRIEGASIALAEEGRGEPVVFVHGDLSDYRTWGEQLPAFVDRHRAIAYSRRYHFPNAEIRPGTDNQMAPHVRDLAALLRAEQAVPAHLVGDSWGAFICLRLAIGEPELVRSLVLAEPPVLPLVKVSSPPKLHEVGRLLLQRPRTATALLRFGATGIGPATAAFRKGDLKAGMRTFAHAALGADVYEGLPEARREQAWRNVKPLAAALLGTGFEPLSESDVRSVSLPTLLLSGERSAALFQRLTDRFDELLPNSRRVEVPGASHSMHEQQPEFYNATVLDFIASLPVAKAS